MLIKTFAVGGIICVLGQLLIDYTSMTVSYTHLSCFSCWC